MKLDSNINDFKSLFLCCCSPSCHQQLYLPSISGTNTFGNYIWVTRSTAVKCRNRHPFRRETKEKAKMSRSWSDWDYNLLPRHGCARFHHHKGSAEAENDRSPLHHWNGCINAPEGVLADATVFTNKQMYVRQRKAASDRQQQWGNKDTDCAWPKMKAGLSHASVSLGA